MLSDSEQRQPMMSDHYTGSRSECINKGQVKTFLMDKSVDQPLDHLRNPKTYHLIQVTAAYRNMSVDSALKKNKYITYILHKPVGGYLLKLECVKSGPTLHGIQPAFRYYFQSLNRTR